jgi:hypothetical protein
VCDEEEEGGAGGFEDTHPEGAEPFQLESEAFAVFRGHGDDSA